MIDEQNQPITQDALAAAGGYERDEYFGGTLVEYWHSIERLPAPRPRDPLGGRDRSIVVKFRISNPTPFVGVNALGVELACPRVRTMQQLEQLLWLLTDGGENDH